MGTNIVVDHASGSWLHAKGGDRYLDLTSGIGVTSLGHCHPNVVEAATQQLKKVIHSQMNCYTHEPMLRLASQLAEIVPKPLDQFHFSNSGAEAVENAVKLARHATGRPNIVVFQGGFHGRTLGAGSLTTAKTFYRAGFQPLMPGVFATPYPYCMHCPCNSTGVLPTRCCNHPLNALKTLFKQQTAPSETAAILIEPVLGEGGYVVPPHEFMPALRALADEHNIILIADEVQSGFGRTGKMFAVEHWNVVPDILVMAKGIASGFPLSAIAATSAVFSKALPGSLGGTYGGNAVACAAASAVIDTFKSENILENVNARSAEFFTGLRALSTKYPLGDVRGRGLMIGVEFNTWSSKNKAAKAGCAAAVQKACQAHGMLVLTTGIYETLRLIPPLNITQQDTSRALLMFEKALADVFGKQ